MKHKTYDDGILYNGDCLRVLPRLIEQGIKVDAVITDIPYGTTDCNWDSIIPFDKMWKCLNQLIKDYCPIILFGSEPFSTQLRASNLKNYKYDWKWNKELSGSFALAKKMPMRVIEDIMVFSNKASRVNYYPIMEDAESKNIRPLHKEMKLPKDTPIKIAGGIMKSDPNYNPLKRYPKNLLTFNKRMAECNQLNRVHPTQKPVALMEYLVKTYTKEGENVLDFTCGSGSTLVACRNTKRRFIGIELDEHYYQVCKHRLKHECISSIF